MPSVRWNVAVSADTDKSIRMHLASRGGARKGDLSRFIESAVQERIMDEAIAEAKTAAAHLTEQEVTDLVDEAVTWARAQR